MTTDHGHGHRHGAFCGVIPPYVHEQMAVHGDEQTRRNALAALAVDTTVRAERLIADLTARSVAAQATAHRERKVHSAGNTAELPGTLVRSEGAPASGDPAVDEAYDGLGSTFDLLQEVFGRNSLDDAGMPLLGTVHYQEKYNNAAWDGRQMIFGDGDGQYFNRFTAAVDVIGHELAHGITTHESDLLYMYQSGALNEHFSDVIGAMVKQYVAVPRQTAADADWIIGAGLFTSAVNGVGLRSMKAPGTAFDDDVLGKDPQPDHMSRFVHTLDDNGGVHINSGIPNRAFCLAATGLGGHSWDRAGRIWYAAMRDPELRRLRWVAQFKDFAGLTIEHAAALFGPAEQAVVADAWQQVGVAPETARPVGALADEWVLQYSWGCTDSSARVHLSFHDNGSFTGELSGQWHQQDGTLLLSFDAGAARYAGTLVGDVATGAMTTFDGADGCWRLTRKGAAGIVGN
ncbi:M4 family metallopeptidase [Kocuria rosea]|uniref:Neutral metalloproteinase n=1 Tax=Kocuria rosea subsp. polaris TaxID=136273 RepID=A0A0A6VUR7_KOCRO|nr:M4 family metallopeptidase [Kocuria polaris]KHD98301.1 peptidase M4 [Kocuria polaris]